jgi:hypothetical protein
MKYAIVNPTSRTVEIIEAKDALEAERRAGLTPGRVDHGTALRNLGIVVGENSLFQPPDQIRYFSIARWLYAGNAVLYAFDQTGETIDYNNEPGICWYGNHEDVQKAIQLGLVEQPQVEFNGEIFWQWPGPKPMEALERLAQRMAEAKGTIQIDDDILIIKLP